MDFRIGRGTDTHRLVPGRKLFLGGIEIPFELGLLGHSDGDVLLHAIADALFGACGLDDIGTHFPNTDPRWKDIASSELLRETWRKVSAEKWRINNLDCDILAEAPRLRPFIAMMRESIADILNTSPKNISVKAGTCEGLGPVGESQAMIAHVTVLLIRD